MNCLENCPECPASEIINMLNIIAEKSRAAEATKSGGDSQHDILVDHALMQASETQSRLHESLTMATEACSDCPELVRLILISPTN